MNQNPEQIARDHIDRQLEASGWLVQDKSRINLHAGAGVAVREYQTEAGPADYVLFVHGQPAGIIEAKQENEGHKLTSHEAQAEEYARARLKHLNNGPLPFVYLSTGEVTGFTDFRDPKPRSRAVFSFHRPETLRGWLKKPGSLRDSLQRLPDLPGEGLRECQIRAIHQLEKSFKANKPRSLIQMATGSGKTFTAITFIYRLLKYTQAQKILFLVDTKNLGEQAEQEFMSFLPNDDNRKFTELYGVHRLKSRHIPDDNHVYISTIQRLYAVLKGQELDESAEEENPNERRWLPKAMPEVEYNAKLPVEYFDFIVIDECHRSIYNLWMQVLDYFDSFQIGLTATPDNRTFAYFQQNVVSEYSHEMAVADGVNVGYDVYLIETQISRRGAELEVHYTRLLLELSQAKGILGQIFTKSQNKIQDPAKLFKLIDLIDKEQWSTMGADIKGKIYEGLLEKNAEDTKSGAGQYFTPRALIKAMVACVRPQPMKTIADPACGTGGFFLAAYDFVAAPENYRLDQQQKEFLKHKTFSGNEIVASTRRLALMNLFLHSIGDFDSENFISPADALVADTGVRVDYVLANPPFGKKSSMTFTNDEGEQDSEDLTYNRQDFWVTTSNKQLNFVQHIRTMLKSDGHAAVVVPDNVLFEGGAGETVRKKLLATTNLHTILRLPTGVFYKQGVKANVIFFDNKPAAKNPWTSEIWIYDFRTNIHFTLKKNPLTFEDLADFIACYKPGHIAKRAPTWHAETNPEGRWRSFTYDEIIARDKTSLDITWIKDKSLTDLDNLPDPDALALEIIENLQAGLEGFQAIYDKLAKA